MPAWCSRGLLVAAIVVAGTAASARAAGLWINLSGSLPIGIYRTVGGPIVRGSIVVVCLPESVAVFARRRGYLGRGDCPGDVEPLGKTVVATAGDSVDVSREGVRINGQLVPSSAPLAVDRSGRPLQFAARVSLRLQTGQLLLLARRRSSFDSRYFGVVNAGAVRVVVKGIGA